MEIDLELVAEFLEEAREQCTRAEAILLGLEGGLIRREHLDELFRFAHTVKGSGMAVGVPHLPEFVHHWEDVLSATRERPDPVVLPPRMVTLFLECNDAVSAFVSGFPGDIGDCVARFAALQARLDDDSILAADESSPVVGRSVAAEPASRVPTTPTPSPTQVAGRSEEPSARAVAPAQSFATPASETAAERDSVAAPVKGAGRGAKGRGGVSAEDTVRVKLSRIDALIRKVGELSVQQELVAGKASDSAGPELDSYTRKLAQLCAEAHDIAMSLRMVPVRPTIQTLRRTCRDTALKLGKDVEFEAIGESAELDINLVQVLSEALVHLVRNAVDHGIETPEQRRETTKPSKAVIRLTVAQQGGNICVLVQDDGKGLDSERIRKKAIERGWIAPDAHPTHTELFEFVFRPGFSTNEAVTEFSGRGVGLDVVSSNIKSLDGSVTLRSEKGVGTTFEILMPLSVAVVDVMRVLVSGYTFLVPLHAIRETVAIDHAMVQTVAGGSEMINLRGAPVAIYDLKSLLSRETRPIRELGHSRMTALISSYQNRAFAFVVDDVVGRQQVVIKPLGQELSLLEGISGSAVLGDGSVGLIVDFTSLITSRGLSRDQ